MDSQSVKTQDNIWPFKANRKYFSTPQIAFNTIRAKHLIKTFAKVAIHYTFLYMELLLPLWYLVQGKEQ